MDGATGTCLHPSHHFRMHSRKAKKDCRRPVAQPPYASNFATVGDAYDVTDLHTSEAPYRPFSSLAVLEFLRSVEANLLGDLTSNPSARKDGG
jgi:hypothetical protein